MSKRYKIIVNPISGRGAGERAIPIIEQALLGYGLDFDIARTERPWHAAELAQQAALDGYDVVVATGGDGTANEVLNGLMQAQRADGGHDTVMGVLSAGRGNDFAFGVGAPADLAAGCRALAQDQRRSIDVGRVVGGLYPQGRYFGNGVGIGFDAVVGFEALKIKWLHGFLLYLVAALKTISLYYRAPLVRIEYGRQLFTQRSLMISIMNGRRMGGGFLMAPQAEMDNGLFDLCITAQLSRLRVLGLMARFTNGSQATHKAVKTGRTRRIVVTVIKGVLPAHADGETLCTEGQSLSLELLPQQISMLCEPVERS